MTKPDLTNTSPYLLSQIIDLSSDADPKWCDEELAEVLDCQLSAALEDDLPVLVEIEADKIRSVAESVEPKIQTLRDLFHHPTPPVELLEWVKTFAKRVRDHPDPLLPEPVSFMLYYTVLAVAWLRHDHRLTTLDDTSLRRGLTWAIDQPWAGAAIQGLLKETLAKLNKTG